jgi:REP element-mobilizing transposase RayT
MRQSYPQRKALRLQHYDYAQNGAYFITLCTHNRECLFGEVVDDKMSLNDAGRMVESVLCEAPSHYKDIVLDSFVIMPNHVHFIVSIEHYQTDAINCLSTTMNPPTVGETLVVSRSTISTPNKNPCKIHSSYNGRPQGSPVQKFVSRFKSTVTVNYIQGVKNNQWRPFHGKLWQRGYYDRIIRNEETLLEIQQYIFNNPAQWASDENNIPQLNS